MYEPLRVKLIFNAASGRVAQSQQQLAEILREMRQWEIVPEVYSVRPRSRVELVVANAIKRGIELIVVAGGDGTLDSAARALLGCVGTLGIIPIGTRNDVALSLGIPPDIPSAVALLRQGRRVAMDIGDVSNGRETHRFLELASVGLISDLYPLADEIQHGDLEPIGELLGTLISAHPSRIRVEIDGAQRLETTGHMAMVVNVPYIGPHLQLAHDISLNDGALDVFVFAEMGKWELVAFALRSIGGEVTAQSGVRHYRAQRVTITSRPAMPVLADGIPVDGAGPMTAWVRPRALTVVAGEGVPHGL